ncbi:RES domain-containing protein [Halorhodospira neutriphila]|uniref:type II RES/Xre toxin-antitoxin system toxin n=1 Tax=Halorhodospira neutriphila TaxID=168379 RepID=UPI00190473E6
MRLWRVVLPRRAEQALSGEGARRFGGRWNHPGQAAVYTSTTLSLAVLEWLAHVDPGDAPPELVAIAYELPADEPITRLELGDLPENWRTYPVAETVRRLGADWLNTGETVALVAPSAIIPVAEERNIVLNPEHTSMTRLSQVWHERITVDPRLVGAEKP